MAIQTKRFDTLHEDFNIASESFAQIRDAGKSVINSEDAFAAVDLSPLEEMVNQLKEMDQGVVEEAMSALEQATRFADDMFGTFTDLAALPASMVDNLLRDILPANTGNNAVISGLANVIKTCQSNAGRGLGLNSKFKLPNCDSMSFGTKNCSSSNTGNLLSKALGAANDLFAKAVDVLGNILRKIVSLASMGFAAGLCGVFAAVIDGVTDKSVITKAAGILLNAEGKGGNTQAVFDISKSLTGINVPAMFPSTIRNVAENISAPLNFFKNDVGVFSEKLTASMDAIDPGYLGSLAFPSVSSLGLKNTVMEKSLTWAGNDLDIGIGNLNSVISTPASTISSAYSSVKSSPITSRDAFVMYA